jgi:hypothetical protein
MALADRSNDGPVLNGPHDRHGAAVPASNQPFAKLVRRCRTGEALALGEGEGGNKLNAMLG